MAETEGLLDKVINDRFHLTGIITVRSPRTIYAAKDLETGTTVAVKFFPPSDAPQAQNETEILQELQHPNIVSIRAAGTHQSMPYFAMERAASSLHEQVGIRMNPERATRITSEMLEGIDHAHQRRVTHGDIKPSNILLTDTDTVKVADWEHAKKQLAQPRIRPLSLLYAAPEQIRGMTSPASDVYSAGVVAYELFTGRKPFYLTQGSSTIYRGEGPSNLGLYSPHEKVIMAALEVNPWNRPTLYNFLDAMRQDTKQKRTPL